MLNKQRIQLDTRGAAMTRARMKEGLSQSELAQLSGVSLTSLARWERDETNASISSLELVADVLGISIDEYVGHKVRGHKR